MEYLTLLNPYLESYSPSKIASHYKVNIFHILIVLSSEAEHNFSPFNEKHKLLTASSCPSKMQKQSFLSKDIKWIAFILVYAKIF